MAEDQTPRKFSIFLPVSLERREQLVRRHFLNKIRRLIGRIPFTQDLVAAYYCAIDSNTPRKVKLILFAALAYFVVPTDLVPDFLIHFGFTDDAAVLTAAIATIGGAIKDEHRDQAKAFFDLLEDG